MRWRILGAVASFGFSGAALCQEPAHLALGSFALGMSQQQVRDITYVGSGVSDTTGMFAYENKLRCSDETDSDYRPFLDDAVKKEGVTVCQHMYRMTGKKSNFTGSWRDDGVRFGSMILQPKFYFHGNALYEIRMTPHMNWRDQYLDALKLKYGAPASATKGSASNAYGASWSTEHYLWKRGVEVLQFDAPSATKDEMFVSYRIDPIAKSIADRVRASKATSAGI